MIARLTLLQMYRRLLARVNHDLEAMERHEIPFDLVRCRVLKRERAALLSLLSKHPE